VTDDPIPADALFIYIGAVPHTENLRERLPTDERGFLLTGPDLGEHRADWPLQRDPYPLESSVPKVMVAGDVRHGSTKRVASAVGEGAMAVQLMHQCFRTHV
jgi:thioredoxin reductase (NADPH)